MRTFCFIIMIFTFSFVMAMATWLVLLSYNSNFSNAHLISNFIHRSTSTEEYAAVPSVVTPVAQIAPGNLFVVKNNLPKVEEPTNKPKQPSTSLPFKSNEDLNLVLEQAEAQLIQMQMTLAASTPSQSPGNTSSTLVADKQ